MENLKTNIKHLVENRNQSMSEMNNGLLQAHGKIGNLDVFFWFNPKVGELENTILNFPKPLYWICTKEELEEINISNPKLIGQINKIIILENDTEKSDSQLNVESTNSVINGFTILKDLIPTKGILLISCSFQALETRKNEIENFLSMY